MLLICKDDHETEFAGLMRKFEDTAYSGDVYDVPDTFGCTLLATGAFEEIEEAGGYHVVPVRPPAFI